LPARRRAVIVTREHFRARVRHCADFEPDGVAPALRLGRRFDSRGGEQSADTLREVRRSRRGPLELVGVRRKAGVVEAAADGSR